MSILRVNKMKYKAIFFDRDGTLTYFNKQKEDWRDRIISEWSCKPFQLPYEKMMNLFKFASEGKKPWYKTLDDEREFFKRFYRHLLIGEGIEHDIENRAELLFKELWCNGDRVLFAETVEVLEYFKNHGYMMGVISDTSPSLEYTLQQLGIAKYFTSFTASSLVGAGKPSPIIFNAALNAQGVSAGANCWFNFCSSDSEKILSNDPNASMITVEGLGFVDAFLHRTATLQTKQQTDSSI